MKRTILVLLTTFLWITASAQFVATMVVKEDIPGICNKDGVYMLMASFKGQVPAVCPVSKDEILRRLNTEVIFCKDNPEYNDAGMICLIINCRGEVVQCKMDNKTKNPELDKQIETVFNSLGTWTAGKLKKKTVDSSQLFSFKIINSVLTFER